MNKEEFEKHIKAVDEALERISAELERLMKAAEEEKYVKETKRNENYEPLFVFGTCTGIRQVNTRALGRPNRCMYTRKG